MAKGAAMSLARTRPSMGVSLARSAELSACVNSRVAETCRRSFSVSPTQYARRSARGNRLRGMSAIKGRGLSPWIKLSVSKEDIKVPRDIQPIYEQNKDHGLWAFFRNRTFITTPKETQEHGRAWETSELNKKSFNDLHTIYWACLKERNVFLTENYTRKTHDLYFGQAEAEDRIESVELTMSRIVQVLRERQTAWDRAQDLIVKDPSISWLEDEGRYSYNSDLDSEKKETEEAKAEALSAGLLI